MTQPLFNRAAQANPGLLLEQLRLLASNPDSFQFDHDQRLETQRLTTQVSRALRDPFEAMQGLVYSPLPLVMARVAQDKGIFAALVASDVPVDVQELARTSGLEPLVLEPVLDYLCTQDMAREATPGHFSATPFTQQLVAPLFRDAVTHFHDNCLPAFNSLNGWLSNASVTRRPTAFQVGHHTTEDFYTWMERHPVQQGAFHRFMEAQFASLPSWLDAMNFETDVLGPGGETSGEHVLFIDVGGGIGQQCAALKTRFPTLKGEVILQDRAAVLAKALDVEGVEKMGYDYLTEQPVKNARAYYFRQIIHNNDDATCVKILQSQLPALGPDSVILIDEKVLPDEKPATDEPGVEYIAALSLAMRAMFNVQERREAHWRRLLDDAGLEIRELKRYTPFNDSLIVVGKKKNMQQDSGGKLGH